MKGRLSPINFLALTLAGAINAVGITLFLSAVNLYDSGLSGLSMFLGRLVPGLPMSVFLIVLNVPFLLLGMKKQGVPFTVYSIYAVAVYSLTAFLIGLAFGDGADSPVAGSDLFLCAVFGGVLSGIGSGLTIRFGGSLDGIEVCGVIFARPLGITVGNFVMAFNVLLYVVVGAVFGSWQLPLYSIVAYFVNSKALDFIVDGLDKTRAAMIVTSEPETLGKELSGAFGRGITVWQGEGFYSKSSKSVLYCVINRFQVAKLKNIVKSNDPLAFVTISEVSDVLGTSLHYGARIRQKEEQEKAVSAPVGEGCETVLSKIAKQGKEEGEHGEDHVDQRAGEGS